MQGVAVPVVSILHVCWYFESISDLFFPTLPIPRSATLSIVDMLAKEWWEFELDLRSIPSRRK
jgi:hypothetical protein